MAIVISILLLFVGIGVLILIHFCIVGRAFRRGFGNTNNNNSNTAVERRSLGSTSMSKEDLEKLPCFNFRAKDMIKESCASSTSPVDCAVCLENFRAGEKCRLLPLCRHSFHAECVDMWLLRTPICPICRASADLFRAAEESTPYGVMVTEASVFETVAREIAESDAGDQTVTERTQSGETGIPVNGSNAMETVLPELRGSQ